MLLDARQNLASAEINLAAAERSLTDRWFLRLEGGPLTHLMKAAETANGAEIGSATVSRVSWWSALGLGVRF